MANMMVSNVPVRPLRLQTNVNQEGATLQHLWRAKKEKLPELHSVEPTRWKMFLLLSADLSVVCLS